MARSSAVLGGQLPPALDRGWPVRFDPVCEPRRTHSPRFRETFPESKRNSPDDPLAVVGDLNQTAEPAATALQAPNWELSRSHVWPTRMGLTAHAGDRRGLLTICLTKKILRDRNSRTHDGSDISDHYPVICDTHAPGGAESENLAEKSDDERMPATATYKQRIDAKAVLVFGTRRYSQPGPQSKQNHLQIMTSNY